MIVTPLFKSKGNPIQIIKLGSDPVTFFVSSRNSSPLKTVHGSSKRTVADLIDHLRRSLPAMCARGADYLDFDAAHRQDALKTVADAGRSLFEALFPDRHERQRFVDVLVSHPVETIQAMDDLASVPWEAIYLQDDLDAEVDVVNFLGYRHPIIRETIQNTVVPNRAGGAKLPDGRIGMGVIEDDALPSVLTGVARALNVALKANDITGLLLPPLVNGQSVTPLKTFVATRSEPKQILHFDCHLECKHTPTGAYAPIQASRVRMSNRAFVDYAHFDPSRMLLSNQPFVFFNVCYGGTVNTFAADGYARHLYASGASCVVTSEASIGDEFAAMFAGSLYKFASDGLSVATSMLEARRRILDKHGNPSALFFSMYAHDDRTLPLQNVPTKAKLDFEQVCRL